VGEKPDGGAQAGACGVSRRGWLKRKVCGVFWPKGLKGEGGGGVLKGVVGVTIASYGPGSDFDVSARMDKVNKV